MNNIQRKERRYFRLQALGEWTKLLSDIEEHGSYRYPSHMDLITSHVLRLMGGWEAACRWKIKNLEERRKEFIELWIESQGKEDVLALGATAGRGTLPCNKKLDFNKFTQKLARQKG